MERVAVHGDFLPDLSEPLPSTVDVACVLQRHGFLDVLHGLVLGGHGSLSVARQ
jgi:hypothetical protein